MTITVDFHSFVEVGQLVDELAVAIVSLLTVGIKKNGRAHLAVSGGSTPIPLFKRLACSVMAWDKVDISLVDERWVAPDASDSNELLVRTYLLQDQAVGAHFCGMKTSSITASDGERECAEGLLGLQRPCDVLLLGMGDDGHTASLFPGAVKLPEAVDMQSGRICMGIAPLAAPHERMTLTLPEILLARCIFLHITGQNKRDVLEQAMVDGPSEDMPIRYVLRHLSGKIKKPMAVYWAK